MTIWDTIATERRRLADDLETLADDQWRTQSQCDAWSVEEVAAHTITPFDVSSPRFVFTMLKNRGNLDKTMLQLAAKVNAANSRADIIAKLRANADSRWTPPKTGAEVPLSEIVVHGQDIRRAVGLSHKIPAETIALALDGIDDEPLRKSYASRIG